MKYLSVLFAFILGSGLVFVYTSATTVKNCADGPAMVITEKYCPETGVHPVRTLALQSRFNPLMIPEAPEGGAHPIGGPAFVFTKNANEILKPLDLEFQFHGWGSIPASDVDQVASSFSMTQGEDTFATLHHAVAAGPNKGGPAMGIGLSNMTGTEYGHLLVAGLPFGLEPDEFSAWLYEGGGLKLQQELYDDTFNENLIVLPVGITSTQGGGWFPEELPNSMGTLCRKPWIVRWPETGSSIWQTACQNARIETRNIRSGTRCANTNKACPANDNPITHADKNLSFGGFVPGGLPHKMLHMGHINAWELNLPYTDVLLMKLVLGLVDTPNEQADISPIIDKAPYLYGGNWHQTLSYIELIINKDVWASLSPEQRAAIHMAARASTLKSWTIGLQKQDEGIRLLQKNGAQIRTWPKALLTDLRVAADQYLDTRADELSAQDKNAFRRVLDHMRDWQKKHAIYNDFGDLAQGDARSQE